jgi:hypothetical protein
MMIDLYQNSNSKDKLCKELVLQQLIDHHGEYQVENPLMIYPHLSVVIHQFVQIHEIDDQVSSLP